MWLASDKDCTALGDWLTGRAEAPSAGQLITAGLAGYAFTILPRAHPVRPELRSHYLALLGRHHQIKAELRPLLQAWSSAGLDVLLFKGFHLAEFVYPVAGARMYGDVDVLLRTGQVQAAAAIARDLGWKRLQIVAEKLSHSHNAFTLISPSGATMVEAHHRALHVNLPWCRAQERITEAMWDNSRPLKWHDLEIREAAPVDMLLIGLILQRSWGSDRWWLRPSDFVDFQQLLRRYRIGAAELWWRASELCCERTLEIFAERCDPWRNQLSLAKPNANELRQWNRTVFQERGLLGRPERLAAALLYGWPKLRLAATFLPHVLTVRRELRRHRNLRSLLKAITPARRDGNDAVPREHVAAGVKWALRLVGTGGYGICLVRSLATYRALRERGWQVDFVSGVRRINGKVEAHAWVEYNGRALWELNEPSGPAFYQRNFRFPGGGARPEGGRSERTA